jgi:hypothetical protein
MATLCLLHGAWHDGSCWEQVVESLNSHGHDATAPDLPFHDPRAGFADRIRPALGAIEGVAGAVVVVGHSMASAYAPAVAAARPGTLLVLLCPGLGSVREGFPWPPTGPDGTSVWDVQTAIDAMYPRLAPAKALALAQRLRPMAPAPDEPPLVRNPDLPTVIVYAADDELFEPSRERSIARDLLGEEPIEIGGGHFPMAEDPRALGDLLDRLASAAALT